MQFVHMDEAEEKFLEMIQHYEWLKRFVRTNLPQEYERWKAGGYLIDSDIMSMYPHLGQIVTTDFED